MDEITRMAKELFKKMGELPYGQYRDHDLQTKLGYTTLYRELQNFLIRVGQTSDAETVNQVRRN